MHDRKMRIVAVLALATAAIASGPPVAAAQYSVRNGTFAGAGGVAGNWGNIIFFTTGEAAAGVFPGSSQIVTAGFWHLATITSTVDVAIMSFHAGLAKDAVVLTWSTGAEASIDGFNVYRSQSGEESFARVNSALIPPGMTRYRDDAALPGRAYLYRLGAVSAGREWPSPTAAIAVPARPATLYQNYPNPFNPETSIAFYLPEPANVTLAVYDVRGALVRLLAAGMRPEGRHAVRWNGTADDGSPVGSGIYYCRLDAGKKTFTKKLVVVR